MTFAVGPEPWDSPDATALREAQQRELRARYDGQPEPGVTPSTADMDAFFVARDVDGIAVACGGLRGLDRASAEIKRMFVRPERRGSGAATAVLAALEGHARDRGWTHLRLETGVRQPDAIAFYSRAGYVRIPNFGGYTDEPTSVCFERALDG
jgi:GNAT superfamily N-acetyltransferase